MSKPQMSTSFIWLNNLPSAATTDFVPYCETNKIHLSKLLPGRERERERTAYILCNDLDSRQYLLKNMQVTFSFTD